MLITSDLLQKFSNLKHGFATKKTKDWEHPENFAQKNICLKQIHSNKIIILDKNSLLKSNYYQADGIITNLKNIAISVFTADCLPILIYASDIKYISVIHSGWKGSFLGIAPNAIEKLKKLGAKVENISIAIMPSIVQDSYQIDHSFYQKFIGQSFLNQSFFKKIDDSYYFDLRAYVKSQLKEIKKLDDISFDTYKNGELFYSYRRKTHRKKKEQGRHISFMILN